MSRVEYYECDKCGQKMTAEQEMDGAIAFRTGLTCGSLCLNCRKTTTVFEAQELSRQISEQASIRAKISKPL